MCRNLANGRVDIEEWLACKTQLHGLEWNESLKADPSNLIFSPKSFVMSQQFFCIKTHLLVSKHEAGVDWKLLGRCK